MRNSLTSFLLGATCVLYTGWAATGSGAPPTLPEPGSLSALPDVEALVQRYGGLFTDYDDLMRYQSSLQSCMEATGFEYIAWTPQQDPVLAGAEVRDADGYGIYIEGGTADSRGTSTDGDVSVAPTRMTSSSPT